jgi:hypothetical protein
VKSCIERNVINKSQHPESPGRSYIFFPTLGRRPIAKQFSVVYRLRRNISAWQKLTMAKRTPPAKRPVWYARRWSKWDDSAVAAFTTFLSSLRTRATIPEGQAGLFAAGDGCEADLLVAVADIDDRRVVATSTSMIETPCGVMPRL